MYALFFIKLCQQNQPAGETSPQPLSSLQRLQSALLNLLFTLQPTLRFFFPSPAAVLMWANLITRTSSH